jgi:hypothetical protein
MSGGHFNYEQYHISEIANSIENTIDNWNEKPTEWIDESCADKYSDATKKEFENAVMALRKAHVYAQRIDWLLSGDDGEDNFHKRLVRDLKELGDAA